jgi:gluconate kinase
MRFLRFLRNDLSVKTSDRGRWLHQVNAAHAQSKSSSKLPSLCSTQPHINGFLDKPLPTSMKRATCAGDPVSHRHRLRTECTHSRLMHLRKKRKKEPV